MSQQRHRAYDLTTAWQRVELADHLRVGTIIQNQKANGTTAFYVASGGAPNRDFEALEILPNGILYEDILAPNGDIWAKAAAAGAVTMTLVCKYRL